VHASEARPAGGCLRACVRFHVGIGVVFYAPQLNAEVEREGSSRCLLSTENCSSTPWPADHQPWHMLPGAVTVSRPSRNSG